MQGVATLHHRDTNLPEVPWCGERREYEPHEQRDRTGDAATCCSSPRLRQRRHSPATPRQGEPDLNTNHVSSTAPPTRLTDAKGPAAD